MNISVSHTELWLSNHPQCSSQNVTMGPFNHAFDEYGQRIVKFNSSIFINGKNFTLGYPPLYIIQQPILADARYYTLPETNHTLTKDFILANSFCRPLNTYQWGFSSLLLLVFCLMSTLFALIFLLLHWDIYWNSRAGRLRSHISIYRDAIDLVTELKRQFGEQVVGLPAQELEQRVHGCRETIYLETDELPLSRRAERRAASKQYDDTNAPDT